VASTAPSNSMLTIRFMIDLLRVGARLRR
jgi:hypothetical protein